MCPSKTVTNRRFVRLGQNWDPWLQPPITRHPSTVASGDNRPQSFARSLSPSFLFNSTFHYHCETSSSNFHPQTFASNIYTKFVNLATALKGKVRSRHRAELRLSRRAAVSRPFLTHSILLSSQSFRIWTSVIPQASAPILSPLKPHPNVDGAKSGLLSLPERNHHGALGCPTRSLNPSLKQLKWSRQEHRPSTPAICSLTSPFGTPRQKNSINQTRINERESLRN